MRLDQLPREPVTESRTRPLLVGYVRRGLLRDDCEIEAVKRRLAEFAFDEGFTMGETYVEQLGRWPAAFAALMDAASRDEVAAVVLPSLLHFAVLGVRGDTRRLFEQTTGARVLVAEARQ